MPVYFFQSGGGAGPVKIGISDNVAMRLVKLSSDNPEPVRVIREINGDTALERDFHRHFKHLHIRGEWYKFCPTMMSISIGDIKTIREDYLPEGCEELPIVFKDGIFQRIRGVLRKKENVNSFARDAVEREVQIREREAFRLGDA